MEALKYFFVSFFQIFTTRFTVIGYEFSFFDLFLATVIVSIVGKALYNLFGGGD